MTPFEKYIIEGIELNTEAGARDSEPARDNWSI